MNPLELLKKKEKQYKIFLHSHRSVGNTNGEGIFMQKKRVLLSTLFSYLNLRNRSYQDLDQRDDFDLTHRFFPYLLSLIQS